MILEINMGAPQALWFVLNALLIVCVGVLHGEPKHEQNYNVVATIIGVAIEFAWLWWGGFF